RRRVRAPHALPTRRSSDLDFDHRQWPKGHWAVRGVFEWFTLSSASEMNIQAAITRTPASNESRSRPQRGWRRLLSVANKASPTTDRKSTRLNSSHVKISYA